MPPDIRLDMGVRQRLEQRLKLAPQVIQSIEILQLPALALEELVQQEMADNPVLELKDPPPAQEAAETQPSASEAEEDDPVQREIAEEWREFSGERSRAAAKSASDRKQEAMLNTAAPPASLQEFLLTQFHLLDVSAPVDEAGTDIILNLDENGYLRVTLEDLVLASDGRYTIEDAEEALKHVQSLDPPGVGARDLRECLLLQVPEEGQELVRKLIADHLEDIERNRLPKMARATGGRIDEIKEAVEYISHLNPRPGSVFSGRSVPRIVPDLVVEYTDKGYEVRLEDSRIPYLGISALYQRLASSSDSGPATREYLREKIRAAHWLIDAIEQRKATLYKISRAIVDVQKGFLDYGLSHLKPLRMQEIADRVGVHVSTVSRAIASKYIQTPRGIFPLKYFFTGGPAGTNGEGETWRTVQQAIKDIVDQEDKSKPLSDDQIAAKLRDKGYPVARRTVTKYRKALAIPSSRRRRNY